jgi:hypothetical protein
MRYDWQGGFYCRGVRAVTGLECDAFSLIAIKGSRVHRVEHHVISDMDADPERDYLGALSTGEAEIMAQLRLVAQCRAAGVWPKESGLTHNYTRPNWKRG